LELSSSAKQKAFSLLARVDQLADKVGETGAELRLARTKLADAANALVTTAQVSACPKFKRHSNVGQVKYNRMKSLRRSLQVMSELIVETIAASYRPRAYKTLGAKSRW
jgi:hypothetical protein